MSDEGRAYVKAHSPYTGNAWWFHYVMGDLANWQHDYEIFVSDARLAQEWPLTRSTCTRARQQLITDGYLQPLDESTAPGRPRRYRFVFKGAEGMAKGGDANAPHGEARQGKTAPHGDAGTRRTTKRERASSVQSHLLPTEEEQKGTEISAAAPPKPTDDPVKKKAHELTVLAMEQPIKPVLRENGKNPFGAVYTIIERLLRNGQSVQAIKRAIEAGIEVWTVAGIQTAIAQTKPRREREQLGGNLLDLGVAVVKGEK